MSKKLESPDPYLSHEEMEWIDKLLEGSLPNRELGGYDMREINLYILDNDKLVYVNTYFGNSIDSVIKKTYIDLDLDQLIYPPIKGVVARTKSGEHYIFKENHCSCCGRAIVRILRNFYASNKIKSEIMLNNNEQRTSVEESIIKKNNGRSPKRNRKKPRTKCNRKLSRKLRPKQLRFEQQLAKHEEAIRQLLVSKACELKDVSLQADVLSKTTESMLPDENKEITPLLPLKSNVDLYRIIP